MTEMDNYTYISIWNMNGGSLPHAAKEIIDSAIESAVKEIEEKENIRILWASGEARKANEAVS